MDFLLESLRRKRRKNPQNLHFEVQSPDRGPIPSTYQTKAVK